MKRFVLPLTVVISLLFSIMVALTVLAGDLASGGGTYFVEVGFLSEFQFSGAKVQCKIGHAVLPDGTGFQMLMFSTSVNSVAIDSEAKTVVITGTMVSTVTLHKTDGTKVDLTETVPYSAYAEDNGTPGRDTDFFSLTVEYQDTDDLDQFDLFDGSPATFGGILESGNIVVK